MPDESSLPALRARISQALSLESNVAAASGAVFLVGLGEELWKKFLPKYLESLGASVGVIGLFGTAEDFLDAIYQYPGGWLADHWGRRRAFLTFIALAVLGYLVYFFSPSWPWLFLALALAMAWQSMASPAVFATIGDALPSHLRAFGFSYQSILKRIPSVISPLVCGGLIGYVGLRRGVRFGLLVTVLFAGIAVLLVRLIRIPRHEPQSTTLRGIWRSLDPMLKRLLVSDIAIRTCEGMADIFAVLYVTDVAGVTVPQYGILVAVQLATSIVVYFPAARAAARIGKKP